MYKVILDYAVSAVYITIPLEGNISVEFGYYNYLLSKYNTSLKIPYNIKTKVLPA
jgi:hypothetical protein